MSAPAIDFSDSSSSDPSSGRIDPFDVEVIGEKNDTFKSLYKDTSTVDRLPLLPLRSLTPPPDEILANYDETVKNSEIEPGDVAKILNTLLSYGRENRIQQYGFDIYTGEMRNPPVKGNETAPEPKEPKEEFPNPRPFIRPPEALSDEVLETIRKGRYVHPRRETHELTDEEVMLRINLLKEELEYFTSKFCAWEKCSAAEWETAVKKMAASTVLLPYITWTAISPAEKFHEIFEQEKKRKYLVFGILSRAIKTHIFDDLLFGAPADHKEALETQEYATRNSEGFNRTAARRAQTLSLLNDYRASSHFDAAARKVTLQLYKLVEPFLTPKSSFLESTKKDGLHPDLHAWFPLVPSMHALYRIVEMAGLLSVDMRACPSEGTAVYHFWFPLLDTSYHEQRMEALNGSEEEIEKMWEEGEKELAGDSMRERREAWHLERARLRTEFENQELREDSKWMARITGKKENYYAPREPMPNISWPSWTERVVTVAFPEITVYRPGGPAYGQETDGSRIRTLSKADVMINFSCNVDPEEGMDWDGFVERGIEKTLKRAKERAKIERNANKSGWFGWLG